MKGQGGKGLSYADYIGSPLSSSSSTLCPDRTGSDTNRLVSVYLCTCVPVCLYICVCGGKVCVRIRGNY
jgi:hypothetical protein